jgi:hypothetical protein
MAKQKKTSNPKPAAFYTQRMRLRRKAKGLIPREVWARREDWPKIRELEKSLQEKNSQKDKNLKQKT